MAERFIRTPINLPEPPEDPKELRNYIHRQLLPAIVDAFLQMTRPFPAIYTVSNLTEDRTFDVAGPPTNTELANVLGTLITDLQRIGRIV